MQLKGLPIIGLLLLTTPVNAGLYFTETDYFWPMGSREAQLWPLANTHNRYDNQRLFFFRQGFQPKVLDPHIVELETKRRQGRFTLEDRINLSFYLLTSSERGDIDLAFALLHRQTQDNFMALGNLAMVHQRRQEWTQAIELMQQALRNWPDIYPGWSQERLQFYRRAELHYLRLLQSRALEQRRSARTTQDVDPIFPGVEFETTRGEYTPGEIPQRSRDRLPPDAMQIVRQLRLWMPFDTRLRWLYAELLNAEGNIVEASNVMNSFTEQGYRSNKRREHARILKRASELAQAMQRDFNETHRQYLFASLTLSNPSGNSPAESFSRASIPALIKTFTSDTGVVIPPSPPPPDDKPVGFFGMSPIQILLSGLAGGVVVGALLLFQIQELARRRKSRKR